MTKKVLIVGGMVKGNGISQFIINTYAFILNENIHFDFVIESGRNEFKDKMKKRNWNTINITPLKTNFIKHLIKWRSLLKYYAKEYDVIHFHYDSLHKFILFYWAKKFKFKRIVIHSHNSYSQGNNFLRRNMHELGKKLITKYATDYFSCSSKATEWFYNSKLINDGKVRMIKNGTELDSYKFSSNISEKMKKELNIEEKFVIGHVGRFETQKNHQFILKVFQEIHKKNKNAILLLVGNGSKKVETENKVSELNLEGYVYFLGIRNDVSQLLQAMDTMLFPSLYEGLPLTLIEAQTSGLQCFVSDSIARETKCSDFLNFISLDESPSKWADEILDKKNYKKCGERINGYLQVKESGFDIKDTARDLESFYLNC